jgi:hypothetical protein
LCCRPRPRTFDRRDHCDRDPVGPNRAGTPAAALPDAPFDAEYCDKRLRRYR